MKASQLSLRHGLILIFIALAFCLANINQHAQTQSQYPAPSVHVSDFANVLDENTRNRLETLLQNLKTQSKIDFYIATVENTGDTDVFEFSRRLATQWNIGARSSASKSLLLVVSVSARTSFTQFSRTVQPVLPDGVLGDMAQRMKAPIGTGEFSEAVSLGVNHFVDALSQKLGFSAVGLERPVAVASASSELPSPSPGENQVAVNDAAKTRPRIVSEPPAVEPVAVIKTNETSAPTEEPKPKTSRAKPTATKRANVATNAPVRSVTSGKKNAAPPVDDEAEAEEVELTLTLPLDKRAIKLKEFLATHPNSKARPRATELLISTHAALGDQKLKNGDPTGIDDLLTAIAETDTTMSDQLFSGVIAQIPMNLYLRNEAASAFKAAQAIETKFGNDPKRLLSVASFYLGIERGDEAARIAEQVVKTAPDLAEAHRVYALGLHVSLRLEEAAAAYKRLLEVDPTSRVARNSLADLSRGIGKPEEALALYTEQLKIDSKDKPAATGSVLSLLDLGRTDEANTRLDSALAEDPRNLALLTGAAYWFVAHEKFDKGFELARKAVEIEPRYTWAQVALARSFIGLKRPLDAERSLRYARQYGKFPTLNYELASVLSSMGLYDEALDVLRESFVINGGQIQTRLAGRFPAANENFIDLLAPERRASIYQNTAADTATSAKILKDLLVFANALTPASDSQKLDEAAAVAAAREFASGRDQRRTFRQSYASSRLMRNGLGFEAAFELAEEAKKAAADGLDIPVLSLAVQADEFRELRAKAIASGNVPDVADAPRSILGDIIRGRSDDLMGWSLFNQGKYEPALTLLKTAVSGLPNGTPAWRIATWHLGAALEQSGNDAGALENYILSYKAGANDTIRRATIEQVYKRVNGSLQGLDEKIGAAPVATTNASPEPPAVAAPSSQTSNSYKPASAEPTPNPEKSPTPTASEPSKPSETNPAPTTVPSPSPEPVPTATEPAPANPTATPTPGASEDSVRAAASRLRSIIRISGRVVDANKGGIGNVVVVLISPSGSVLASTTDTNGNFAFTVAPSQKTYRLIPSKDGLTFTPVDRTFAGLFDDQINIEFVGAMSRP
jgi:uncharacterized membrane protein YgcG/tetratricopeptide (TPR) repeat protein